MAPSANPQAFRASLGRKEGGVERSVVRGSRFSFPFSFPSFHLRLPLDPPSLFHSRLFWRFFSPPSVRYRVMPRLLRFSVVPRSLGKMPSCCP